MNGFVANINHISFFSFLQLDMKYLSPLLLAYEDRMKEQDALLQTTEVKYLCATFFCVYEVFSYLLNLL